MTLTKKTFNIYRFHKDFGPTSLFERVYFKMKDRNKLKLHSKHFKEKVEKRKIPLEVINKIENFNINEWELISVEIRGDKFKFINSTWEKHFSQGKLWIVIGFNDTVMTAIWKNGKGLGSPIIKNGLIYDLTQIANRNLMNDENE